MRRTLLMAPLAGLAVLAASFSLLRQESPAASKKEAGKSSSAALLPISQVVLFSSGVGYFQREGTVEDTQRVDLSFQTADVNDLIKSLTLRDLDDGHISAVSCDSNVPVERTLRSFAVNLASNPTFGQILDQARGEKVEVVLQQAAAQPGSLTGSVVGIEKKTIQVGKDVVEAECLNLWCADGMRSVKLSEVQRVRFLNAIMESEFKKALETLARGHDSQKKTVSIHFAGKGKRAVKVGYVVENPVWKTSYRLALSKEKEKKPYLQGWAVVENTTDEDWNGVKMALISGRPISFQMNLYDALFVKRPVVEPELFASLRPPSYSGGLTRRREATEKMLKEIRTGIKRQERLRTQTEQGRPSNNVRSSMPQQDSIGGNGLDEIDKKRLQEMIIEWGKLPYREREAKLREFVRNMPPRYRETVLEYLRKQFARSDANMDLGGSVASAATGMRSGDYFQYAIDHAVSLPRQKSALLPIVGQDVEGQRVSIYNEGTHAKFPLLGLVLKNTTGMHLTQGPVTVYEGSTYAGDARIADLQKNERRLLSYAIDLGTEVHAVPHSDNGRITSVKVVKGILYTTTKVKDSKTYTVANRNDVDRVLLIEHPNRTDFKLTSKDQPWETARDVHRFKVTVPAGKTVPFTVSEEKDFGSQVVLTNSDDQSIRVVINQKVTSDKVKAALQRALELRGKMAASQRELQQQVRQLADITADQDRLRKNLKEMPPTAAAYKRYLKKFDDQETQIEKYQALIKELQDSEHAQRKTYESFLSNLDVE